MAVVRRRQVGRVPGLTTACACAYDFETLEVDLVFANPASGGRVGNADSAAVVGSADIRDPDDDDLDAHPDTDSHADRDRDAQPTTSPEPSESATPTPDPEPTGDAGFPWWIILIVLLVLGIIITIIVIVRRR